MKKSFIISGPGYAFILLDYSICCIDLKKKATKRNIVDIKVPTIKCS